MLPIILVLLFATGALAAPTVEVNLNSINDVAPVPSNGRPIGSYLIINALDSVDGGDKNVFVQSLVPIMADISNLSDPISQGSALAGAVAILNELSSGYPGDACVAANFINSYVNAIHSGNVSDAIATAASYVRSLAASIDFIAQLALNPVSARFANGRRGNCQAGGAVYQFEAAWDLIGSNAASPDLFQEHYCAVKRLYNGFSAISRNVGAAATAAAQSHVAKMFEKVAGPVSNFLVALASGSPQTGYKGRIAQQALISVANNS